MRPRNQLDPRELAREGRRRAGRMRAWSGGRPDQAPVLVEKRLEDGRYQVKRDGWAYSIYVPASPAGAKIPTPRRMPLLFENGNSQRPFLHWPWSTVVGMMGPGAVAVVAAALEWYLYNGSGGHYAVPLPDGTAATDLSASPQTITGGGAVRTSAKHLYRAFASGGHLAIARHPIGNPGDPEVWDTELPAWGPPRVFALLGGDSGNVELVVSAATSLYRLRWQAEPVWSLTRSDDWQWWGDAVPVVAEIEVEDSEPISVEALAILVYDYSQCGTSLVRADTGEEIRAQGIPWKSVPLDWPAISADINRPAEHDAYLLHTGGVRGELTAIRASAFRYQRGPAVRGLLVGSSQGGEPVQRLIPACNYSDQIVALDPSTGEAAWTVDGWRDYDPAEPTSPYERLTPVAISADRLLAFISRLGIAHRPLYYLPDFERISFGAIGLFDRNALSLIAGENPESPWGWVFASVESPDWANIADHGGTEAWGSMAEALTEQTAAFEDWVAGASRSGLPCVASVEHFWRTYSLADGEQLGEISQASIDPPLINAAAPSAPEWTKIKQPEGIPLGVAVKATTRTRTIGMPWPPDDYWPDIPEGKVEIHREWMVRRRGTWRICDDPSSVSGLPSGGWVIPYPYPDGASYRDFPGHVIGLGSSAQFSTPPGEEHSPLLLLLQPGGAEIYQLYTGAEWTEEHIVAARWYGEPWEAELYVDASPRCNPVEAVVVDGRAIFGPGRRMTGENPEGGSGGGT